jgi:hypothetical protein
MRETVHLPGMRSIARVSAAILLCALPLRPTDAQGVRRGLEPRSAAPANGGFGTYHAIIFAVGDQQPGSGLPSLRKRTACAR